MGPSVAGAATTWPIFNSVAQVSDAIAKAIDVARLGTGDAPIANTAGPSTLPLFEGQAWTAEPFNAPAIPQNPSLGTGQWSDLDDDALGSNSYTVPGPLGNNPTVTSRYTMECTSVTFIRGVMVGVCYGFSGAFLQIFTNSTTLERGTLWALPSRNLTNVLPKDFRAQLIGGGAYYVDGNGDIVMPTSTNHIWVIGLVQGAAGPTFQIVHDYNLDTVGLTSQDLIETVHPDWLGRIWFATRHGNAGYVDPTTGAIHTIALDGIVDNAVTTAPDGGVFITTTQYLYRLDVDADGTPFVTWSYAYPNDGVQKDPDAYAGTGTTPSILEVGGHELVAIADNATPLNVDVLNASNGSLVCSVPAFDTPDASTSTSMIGVGSTLIVTNQYGYYGPGQTPASLKAIVNGTLSEPGMTRIDVSPDASSCSVVWQNDTIRVPSGVPKLSLATGLIYAVDRQIGTNDQDLFYVQAIDVQTGKVVWEQQYGTGATANNDYSAITLGPDGALYEGGLLGLYRIADGGTP